jgi:solute carrier family 13 (sodium-dependent dicarboxylate transporter), member 2/3/5
MRADKAKKRAVGYDRYINYKTFGLAVGAFIALLFIPVPSSMLDVAVEFSWGEKYVLEYFAQEFYGVEYDEAPRWQVMSVQVLEANMRQGTTRQQHALKKDGKWIRDMGIEYEVEYYDKHISAISAIPEDRFMSIMQQGNLLRHHKLTYDQLSTVEKEKADKAARNIKVVFAMVAFVVICFITEAMPLPGVAFCIGLILVFSGIVSRREIASLFWSDAVWFIMGSLMFAAAFVKTGVDKRICLVLFRYLAKPRIAVITGIMILVISPSAAFISDHALAAMFLPIAMILYTNSLGKETAADPELAKMLFITIAMACNVGGFGSPSGGARNVILMTYLEDMFNINIGYGEWIIYGFPYVLIMMVFVWLMVNWRFKPKIKDLGPALAMLKQDMAQQGGWSRKQIVTVIIFVVMVLGWITEKEFITGLIGVRLGIGVIAIAGAVAYLIAGVVNWRDYQEKVDWGVVWLYAGAIVFGKVLSDTGTAYWLARSIIEAVQPLGMAAGTGLLVIGTVVTAGLTQLMADGPTAACVGPITLNMAAVANPGSAYIPFMGLVTAAASSMAYLLVIGTPPNAIVYASGYLEPKDFLRVGIPCLIFGIIVLILLSTMYWTYIGFQNMPL